MVRIQLKLEPLDWTGLDWTETKSKNAIGLTEIKIQRILNKSKPRGKLQ